MAYCTTDELAEFTGSALDADTVLSPLIAKADRQIDARLEKAGISGTEGDNYLKNASLNLSAIQLITRQQLDGSRPGSLSLGGALSFSNNLGELAKRIKDEADEAINAYIATYGNGPTYIIKVNG